MFYLNICMCTSCVPGALEGQERMLALLELELQTVMS